MTYRQWVEKYAGNKINRYSAGGVIGCPMDKTGIANCNNYESGECDYCWDREMPGTKVRAKVKMKVRIKVPVWKVEEEHDNCFVQILRNPQTGELSIGWRINKEEQ